MPNETNYEKLKNNYLNYIGYYPKDNLDINKVLEYKNNNQPKTYLNGEKLKNFKSTTVLNCD